MMSIMLAVLIAIQLLSRITPIMRTVITIAMIAIINAKISLSMIIITSRSRFFIVQAANTLVWSWKFTRPVKMRAMPKAF